MIVTKGLGSNYIITKGYGHRYFVILYTFKPTFGNVAELRTYVTASEIKQNIADAVFVPFTNQAPDKIFLNSILYREIRAVAVDKLFVTLSLTAKRISKNVDLNT